MHSNRIQPKEKLRKRKKVRWRQLPATDGVVGAPRIVEPRIEGGQADRVDEAALAQPVAAPVGHHGHHQSAQEDADGAQHQLDGLVLAALLSPMPPQANHFNNFNGWWC